MTMPPDLPEVLEIDLTVPGLEIDPGDVPLIELTPTDPTVFGVVSPGPTGPAGPAGDGGFTFTQTTPSANWIITNTLGRKPASVTAWISDEMIEPDIVVSPAGDVITVTFAYPVTGRVEVI